MNSRGTDGDDSTVGTSFSHSGSSRSVKKSQSSSKPSKQFSSASLRWWQMRTVAKRLLHASSRTASWLAESRQTSPTLISPAKFVPTPGLLSVPSYMCMITKDVLSSFGFHDKSYGYEFFRAEMKRRLLDGMLSRETITELRIASI